MIKFFEQLTVADKKISGGKGFSLGELTRSGVTVPPGFVILSNAFDRVFFNYGLDDKIRKFLEKTNFNMPASVSDTSKKIRMLVEKINFPINFESEIVSAFLKLHSPFVAVRSSATAEDSMSASWAGELESYLNTDRRSLISNIRKCWSSLYTTRAIVYRREKKMLRKKISVAVIVQKMIQSKVSGITFTVHPVTEDRRQILIEAGWGLGEAIVSGSITPDSYMIDKRSGRLQEVNVSQQRTMIVRRGRATVEQRVPNTLQNKRKLDDRLIVKLALLCANIEKHYCFPCDIEWAFDGKKFYIVQSRPITTLKSK